MVIILLVGILIGVGATVLVYKVVDKEKNSIKENDTEEKFKLDENPYTLQELYDITDNPEKYYELNNARITDYNIVMFHFYDYFTKDTPVKVATKCETNESYKVTKVLETEYIDYYEYLRRMESAYKYEEMIKEVADKDGVDPYSYYSFRYFIEDLIYPYSAKVVKD